MKNSQHCFTKTETTDTVSVSELEKHIKGWLLACDIDQHSEQTLSARRFITGKLIWFLRQKNLTECGVMELRQFFRYCTHGHEEPGGRWGNPRMTAPVRPRTVHTYHGHLRTLFRWIVGEGDLNVSPMERIPVPTSRADQIQPYSDPQVDALLTAARRSRSPRRDEAILFLLFDTGLRASELCSLTLADVDISARTCTVIGKGNKRRTVPFQKTAARVLWAYLKDDKRDDDDPLFPSERGDFLTRNGLLQLMRRLGQEAHVSGADCHRWRHTMAVGYLRTGGNVFSLQQILGHTSLHMTNRYVALAQADIENQHKRFSPVEAFKKGGRR